MTRQVDKITNMVRGMEASHEDLRADLRQILDRLEELKAPDMATGAASVAFCGSGTDNTDLEMKLDALLDTCNSLLTEPLRSEDRANAAGTPEAVRHT